MNAIELANELKRCVDNGSTDLVCVQEAAFLLMNQKITIDLLRKQISTQKNIINLQIDLLNDLSAEIDRLNEELKKASEK